MKDEVSCVNGRFCTKCLLEINVLLTYKLLCLKTSWLTWTCSALFDMTDTQHTNSTKVWRAKHSGPAKSGQICKYIRSTYIWGHISWRTTAETWTNIRLSCSVDLTQNHPEMVKWTEVKGVADSIGTKRLTSRQEYFQSPLTKKNSNSSRRQGLFYLNQHLVTGE